MEKGLMGSTVEKLTDECVNKVASTTVEDANKKRAYGAMMSMSANGATIANAMEDTNRELKESRLEMKESRLEMKEKNRIAKNSQIISLAKHLDNKELLESLLLKLRATVESP
jgi:translation initiation factor 2 beta subunit (eIF-2beta)/eIF-5